MKHFVLCLAVAAMFTFKTIVITLSLTLIFFSFGCGGDEEVSEADTQENNSTGDIVSVEGNDIIGEWDESKTPKLIVDEVLADRAIFLQMSDVHSHSAYPPVKWTKTSKKSIGSTSAYHVSFANNQEIIKERNWIIMPRRMLTEETILSILKDKTREMETQFIHFQSN